MKKILFAVLAASLLAGCGRYEPAERKDPSAGKISSENLGWTGGIHYDLVTVDGHVYISASGVRCVSLAHAESCPCKAKK